MATARQQEAARRNIAKAHEAQHAQAHGAKKSRRAPGLSAAEEDRLDGKDFAFPKQRKEPIVDARHVRNAVARFNQVEGVTQKERDQAWNRIKRAATRFDVAIEAGSWRELGGKAEKR